ncbi:hypothetical protein ACE0DR_14230 [Azotobacter sp. CWF10]
MAPRELEDDAGTFPRRRHEIEAGSGFFEALVEWADDPRRWIRFLRQTVLTLSVIGVPYACSSLYHDNAQRHVDAALDMAMEDCALNRMAAADADALPQYKACVKSLVRRYGR